MRHCLPDLQPIDCSSLGVKLTPNLHYHLVSHVWVSPTQLERRPHEAPILGPGGGTLNEVSQTHGLAGIPPPAGIGGLTAASPTHPTLA
eukprot:CAMPEP_0118986966 /NCGR_PEP_ID=MMETSP1173-20130426/43202_1 /TAXON_ID=1034831 /ORGANISM="Rhizochromulina marina cf, Strain CCMP1243" /LENGTH=88 /DNA_ID=CAMNT_0006937783 /DNA_START=493 /DNA_END=756 /DNA_ORIENTATION=+